MGFLNEFLTSYSGSCFSFSNVSVAHAQVFGCTGFSFVYMEDERDAEDAIRHLDNMEFGRQRRRLSVEWAKVVWQSNMLENLSVGFVL